MKQFINPHPVVADPGQLGTAKTNRKNMHNTTMAFDSISNSLLKQSHIVDFSPKKKVTNDFADIICEFSELLTPEELYQCLVDAMEAHCQHTKKEFDHATKLLDLIK
jgi:7,8-dihydro-6-hydroxymethylpterin-pyrophosphokinase